MRSATFAVLALTLPALAACGSIREAALGPKMGPMAYPAPLVAQTQPVLASAREPAPQPASANSLWRTGARAFFADQRAGRVGDILTVLITIDDSAKTQNATSATKTSSNGYGVPNFFGLESQIPNLLQGADPTNLVNMGSTGAQTGTGSVNRSEQISLTLAALVTQVMPNGNLVINGHQQVRVNSELRDLQISGVVRTEDITSDNTVNLAQIAEARIAYGGQGQITNMQEPRFGEQLFDILMPF